MKTISFQSDYPKIVRMASGHLSLELSDQVSLDVFPEYAEKFISLVNGNVKERNDSIIMCIWKVVINECEYRLVFDDYPCGVSLESESNEGDRELIKIKETIVYQCS